MESSASNIGFYALVAAAGGGSRLGGDTPKQYLKIGGKSILHHAVDAFLACPGMRGLKVIIDPAHEPFFRQAFGNTPLPAFVHGSDTRKYSISNGLYSFSKLKNEDIILVHDAARPFV
ncbi:MAG: 2-C-methyl-D-erythritol 4-phosphate cytidylyltransferase, partial [Proteobacteria bacterium]|nr:2-C-methyl-D-erythritol 4-phosphate cytidylyltransferase [Pseudomonadota bacterium]